MKKRLALLLVFVLAMSSLLVGCGKGEGEETKGEAEKVALVVAGGLGDRSFYDSSHEGVEKAKEELGVEYKVYECRNDPSLFNDQLIQASEYAPIVAVVGFEFYDVVQDIAKEFPDVNYIYVDNEIEGIDNLTTISY